MYFNAPNSITWIRILLIPLFVGVYYFPENWLSWPAKNWTGTIIFSLAAITDWFDGYLARRLGQTSAVGAFLDPVADKLMVAAALIVLVNLDRVHPVAAIIIIAIMVCYVGMVYGPIGAFLAEYFPGRIRYTSVSVPYHIGNGWGGGLVPFITNAAFLSSMQAGLSINASLGYALIYPIAVPAVCFVLGLFLMPETRHNSIWKEAETAKAPA